MSYSRIAIHRRKEKRMRSAKTSDTKKEDFNQHQTINLIRLYLKSATTILPLNPLYK